MRRNHWLAITVLVILSFLVGCVQATPTVAPAKPTAAAPAAPATTVAPAPAAATKPAALAPTTAATATAPAAKIKRGGTLQRIAPPEAAALYKVGSFLSPGFTISNPPDVLALQHLSGQLRPGVIVYDADYDGYDDLFLTECRPGQPFGECRSFGLFGTGRGFRRVEYSQAGTLGLIDNELGYLGYEKAQFLIVQTAGGQTGTLEVFANLQGAPNLVLKIQTVKAWRGPARLAEMGDGTQGISVTYLSGDRETESIYRWTGISFQEEVRRTGPIQY